MILHIICCRIIILKLHNFLFLYYRLQLLLHRNYSTYNKVRDRRLNTYEMYRQLSKEAKNMVSESNEINNGHHLNRSATMPNSTASSLNQLQRNSTVNNEDERQRLHCKNAIHLAVPMAKKVCSIYFSAKR